jgi:hypothetical protein
LAAGQLADLTPPFLSKIRQLFIIIIGMNYKIYVKISFKIGVRVGRLS